MAYSTGSYASLDALMTSLFSFATANGWTQDQLNTTTDEAALHHTAGNNIHVSFDWGSGNSIGIHQALGYTGGNSPGAHPNDSGNGDTGSNTERRVAGIDADGTYYFFSNFHSEADFIYIVLEYSSGIYRHFGFGELAGVYKSGNWTGGEFAYGHEWGQGAGNIDSPIASNHSFLLDGGSNSSSSLKSATIHMEGFPDIVGTSKWGVVGLTGLVPGNDAAGVLRYIVTGGARSSVYINSFSPFLPSVNTGIFPGMPLPLFAVNKVPSQDRVYFLGYMPDCRMLSIGSFTPAQEITIGSETWTIFPAVRKQKLELNTEESWNMGVMYRKA